MVELLSLKEKHALDQLEARIETGLAKFMEVGPALAEICQGKLYRSSYGTFQEYCRERWGISRQHAHRLIEAACVIRDLSPMGYILPANERQARALARVDPRQLHSLWAELTADGSAPTTAEIEAAVRQSGIAVPPPEALRAQVRHAEAEAAREARSLGDRDRVAAGERVVRKALALYGGLGELGEEVCARLREALAVSVRLVA